MTRRLTSRSLAGTSRNDVAVGTSRLLAMFLAMSAAAPRMTSPGISAVPSAEMPVDFAGSAAGAAAGAGVAAGAGASAFTAAT